MAFGSFIRSLVSKITSTPSAFRNTARIKESATGTTIRGSVSEPRSSKLSISRISESLGINRISNRINRHSNPSYQRPESKTWRQKASDLIKADSVESLIRVNFRDVSTGILDTRNVVLNRRQLEQFRKDPTAWVRNNVSYKKGSVPKNSEVTDYVEESY